MSAADVVDETPPELSSIPLFEDAETRAGVRSQLRPLSTFGVYNADRVTDRRALPLAEVDWSQVVSLRKEASSAITDETQDFIAETGRPIPTEDRRLMGRAIIRRVVADHVRALHRDGAALWSTGTELAYVQAVEDAVFGFGRLQPLFELTDAENIEIHGCNLAGYCAVRGRI